MDVSSGPVFLSKRGGWAADVCSGLVFLKQKKKKKKKGKLEHTKKTPRIDENIKKDYLRAWQEGAHLQTKERGLRGNQL